MNFSILWTHSTGKTTLANLIDKKLWISYVRWDSAIALVNQICPGKTLDQMNQDEMWEFQKLFMQSIIDDNSSQKHSFVTDANTISCVPYSREFMNVAELDWYDDFIQKAIDNVNLWVDRLLYLPPEIWLKVEWVRPDDNGLRLRINRDFLKVLDDNWIEYNLVTWNIARRLWLIERILSWRDESIRNRYISFEWLPRVGKTTQIAKTIKYLRESWEKVHLIERKPLYIWNKKSKDIAWELYKNPYENKEQILDLFIETFLHHYKTNNIEDRLFDWQVVISDRQKFSIIAMGSALWFEISEIYSRLYDLPNTGHVLYLDIDSNKSVERAQKTQEYHNLKNDLEFQTKVRESFLWLTKHHIEFRQIIAKKSISNVWKQIKEFLDTEIIWLSPLRWQKEQIFQVKKDFKSKTAQLLSVWDYYPTQWTDKWWIQDVTLDISYQLWTLLSSISDNKNDLNKEKIAEDIADIEAELLYIAHLLGLDFDTLWKNSYNEDYFFLNLRQKYNISSNNNLIEKLVILTSILSKLVLQNENKVYKDWKNIEDIKKGIWEILVLIFTELKQYCYENKNDMDKSFDLQLEWDIKKIKQRTKKSSD